MRAGWQQVIDVVAIVVENAFRPYNGRTVSFMAMKGVFAPVLALLDIHLSTKSTSLDS